MSLNIKNEETHQLARELARALSSESMTGAITVHPEGHVCDRPET